MFAIPVTLLGKRHGVLSHVDVYDESGRVLPIMVTQDVWRIGRSMLEDLLRTAIGSPVLPNDYARQIEQIVSSSAHNSVKVTAQLLAELENRYPEKTAVAENAALAFGTLATDLAEQFLLVALISGSPGQRRVVKFEYEDECLATYSHQRAKPKEAAKRLVATLKALPAVVATQVGLTPLPMVIGMRDVAYALSYHVEIPSPDGLYLLRCSFDQDNAGSWEQLVSAGVSERAHLYLYNQHRSVKTILRAQFCMQPSDWPALGLTSAALTFGILVAGLVLHQFLGRHPDVGGAPAVLAVLPGVLAAMYLRSGEHPTLRWMVRGIRMVVVLLMAISLASAGTLAVRPGPAVWVWSLLTILAFALLCVQIAIFVKTWRPPGSRHSDVTG